MQTPSVVIIARPEHIPLLRSRLGSDEVSFPDSESLRALEAILKRRPTVVGLDAAFVMTARGAALIARLRAEAATVDIRVLMENDARRPLLLNHHATVPEAAVVETSRPLDRCGTRRAARFPMNGAEVIVNGERGQLIDLSIVGAQVIARVPMRPAQPLRLTISDENGELRCNGRVAWSVVTPVGGAMHYRAGVEFVSPQMDTLEDFCRRRGTPPDVTFSAA